MILNNKPEPSKDSCHEWVVNLILFAIKAASVINTELLTIFFLQI